MPPDESRQRGAALITGASSGIGQVYARRLAAQGSDLVLVARRRDRLETLAAELGGAHGVDVEVLIADLAGATGQAAVEERLGAGSDIGMVVNNAGFSGYMAFTDLPMETADELIEVHVRAVTRLTRAALDGMLPRGRGAIINIASLLAFSESLPAERLPKRATYAACKAYLVTFTQLLHHEVAAAGIRLQICCPGLVATEFHDATHGLRLPVPPMSAEDVVTASLLALERGELVCIPGLDDVTDVDRYHELQRELLAKGNRPDLAARYSR